MGLRMNTTQDASGPRRKLKPKTPDEIRDQQKQRKRDNKEAKGGRQNGSKGKFCNVSLGVRVDENHENMEGQNSNENAPGSEEDSTSGNISPSVTSEDGSQASRFIWNKKKEKLVKRKREAKFTCLLGCGATFAKPAQHYRTSEKHKKTKEEARRLSLIQTRMGKTSKGNRQRKYCPLETCDSISSRMSDHLKKEHNITDKKRRDALSRSARPANRPSIRDNMGLNDRRSVVDLVYSRGSEEPEQPKSKKQPSSGIALPKSKNQKDSRQYTPQIQTFANFITTQAGGSVEPSFAKQIAQQVHDFFDKFAPEAPDCSALNVKNLSTFVNENLSQKRAKTKLMYINSLQKYLSYCHIRQTVSVDQQSRSITVLNNLNRSLAKQANKEKAERALQDFREMVPAAARLAFFDSPWTRQIQQELSNMDSIEPSRTLDYRNYLLTTITLWNGNRSGALRVLNYTDMKNPKQNEVKDVGNGQAKTFKYISVHVAKHKTSGTYGAARITLPEAIFIHLYNFSKYIENIHGSSHESLVFRNQDGTQVASASTISGMLKRGWEQSGVRAQFPQKFNATKNRSMMITICRDKDPAKAELMAAQMCHSVFMATQTYALQQRTRQSAEAVHFAAAASREAAEQQETEWRPPQSSTQSSEGADQEECCSPAPLPEAGNDEGDHCSSPIDDTGNDDMAISSSPFHDCEAEAPVEVQEQRPTPQEEPQRTAETRVSFDREVDRSHMRVILSNFIRSINWDEYMEEALFWVARGGYSALARQTINNEIYQSVSNYMEGLGLDLEGTLHPYIERQEVPEEYSESEVSVTLQTLIGVEFAISLGPSINKKFDKPEVFGLHNRATEDIRSSRVNQGPAAASEPQQSTSSEVPFSYEISGRQSRLAQGLEHLLRELFKEEIEQALPNCDHIPIATVRRNMAAISAKYEVNAQQVRDKLFNITKSMRKALGLNSKKGGGKVKRSKPHK